MLFLVVEKSEFIKRLYEWYESNKRVHPWMSHKDPYKIWLFEIIMQQTRISQGLPYYHRFVEKYPTVEDLANAKVEEVLKLWEGLGYYSRARNLHFAAKQVDNEYDGVFPVMSKDLQKLRGIGKYTSAAIASFAHNEPVGVVDGNVYRVLSRVFGVADPIDQSVGQRKFYALAQRLVDEKDPAIYNQAIMDFGALQCTPKVNSCKSCTMTKYCHAYNNDQVGVLPVKSKKLKKRVRYFNYLVIEYSNKVVIRQRIEKDIWQLLYEYPYQEGLEQTTLTRTKIKQFLEEKINYTQPFEWKNEQKPYKQQLTHQTIIASYYKVTLSKSPTISSPYLLVNWDDINNYAFPKIIDCYLNDNSISLFE